MNIFAPEGQYPAAGMFTPPHLISLAICVVMIIVAVFLTKNMSDSMLKKTTIGIAIFVTVCEIVKIIYKFAVCGRKFSELDSWFPLYYCSLFIYVTWMALSRNEKIRNLGIAFLTCGCITGGSVFLVCPSTSLMMVPIWHFLSIHSMLFHSMMVYLGFIYILKGYFTPDKKQLLSYALILVVFMVPALLLNLINGCNMMMLREPFNMPIAFVYDIYNAAPAVYTILAILVYYFVPFGISSLIYLIIKKIRAVPIEKSAS